jgi:hypothetical protein
MNSRTQRVCAYVAAHFQFCCVGGITHSGINLHNSPLDFELDAQTSGHSRHFNISFQLHPSLPEPTVLNLDSPFLDLNIALPFLGVTIPNDGLAENFTFRRSSSWRTEEHCFCRSLYRSSAIPGLTTSCTEPVRGLVDVAAETSGIPSSPQPLSISASRNAFLSLRFWCCRKAALGETSFLQTTSHQSPFRSRLFHRCWIADTKGRGPEWLTT